MLVLALLAGCTAPVEESGVVEVGPMALARAAHTATPLPDGRVLIAGGCTSAGCGGTPEGGRSEIFDPVTRRFENGPQLVNARAGHPATRLSDGRILFAGGYSERTQPTASAVVAAL